MLTYLLPSHFLLSLLSCFWFLTHFCVLLLPYTYIVTIVMWRASSPKFALKACVQKKFLIQVQFCNKMTSRQNAPTKNKHKWVNIGIDFILILLASFIFLIQTGFIPDFLFITSVSVFSPLSLYICWPISLFMWCSARDTKGIFFTSILAAIQLDVLLTCVKDQCSSVSKSHVKWFCTLYIKIQLNSIFSFIFVGFYLSPTVCHNPCEIFSVFFL